MIFGSASSFAIEAMTEPDLQAPSPVWGRMRIWCQDIAIGDITNPYCGLYGSYLGFRELRTALPSLWLPEFADLSDWQIWNRLNEALYGYHGNVPAEDSRSNEDLLRDLRTYRKFDFLTNWGEQFDNGGKSFIVCTPEQQVRILNRKLPKECGLSVHTSVFAVARATKEFLGWFEHEAERLGNPVA